MFINYVCNGIAYVIQLHYISQQIWVLKVIRNRIFEKWEKKSVVRTIPRSPVYQTYGWNLHSNRHTFNHQWSMYIQSSVIHHWAVVPVIAKQCVRWFCTSNDVSLFLNRTTFFSVVQWLHLIWWHDTNWCSQTLQQSNQQQNRSSCWNSYNFFLLRFFAMFCLDY